MSSDPSLESASPHVVHTTGSEALAFLAVLASVARANDDVLVIDTAPAWLETVCGVTRVRLRTSSRDGAFDAIGEHTRALVVATDDAELIEALVELGPSVIALSRTTIPTAITIAGSIDGVTITLPEPSLASAIARTLSTLTPNARTLPHE